MKTRFASIFAIAALGAFAFASCEISTIEEIVPAAEDSVLADAEGDGSFVVCIEAGKPGEEDVTRTEFNDTGIQWAVGDVVRFGQYTTVGGEASYKEVKYTVKVAMSTLSCSTTSFVDPGEEDAYYFSAFPSSAVVSYNPSLGRMLWKMKTPEEQTPTAVSFDPNSDLLVSEYIKNLEPGEDGKYSLKFSYKRLVSIAKMNIINLPSANAVTSVEFSAVKSGSAVTLAGVAYADFQNGDFYSVPTRKDTLTLDYSGLSLSAAGSDGMTAYYCCYPFSLAEGDSFTVKVTTSSGEIFTRKVVIPSGRTLEFIEGRGTKFAVDMSSAQRGCSWFEVAPYSSASYPTTISETRVSLKSTIPSVASCQWGYVKASEFDPSDIDSYATSTLSETSLTSINSGKSVLCKVSGDIDTEYIFVAKVSDGTNTVTLTTSVRTDWFKLALVGRSAGGVQIQMTGVGLDPSKTRNYRLVATSSLGAESEYESYYTNTLAPGLMPESNVKAINDASGSVNYGITKYYADKTTQASTVAGESYTALIKVTNMRGETKFCHATAVANEIK